MKKPLNTYNDKDPLKLSIPGKLSFSEKGGVIFGWEEDWDNQDAMLIAMGEVMDL